MRTISEILERKKAGIDCTEEESAKIKGFLKEVATAGAVDSWYAEQCTELEKQFPIEASEVETEINSDNEIRSADEIIDDISAHLRECDGEFIAEIANKVLDKKVTYINDSIFKIE